MPDHETVKYVKDLLTVGLLVVVTVQLVRHFVSGGSLSKAANLSSVAS